MLERKEDTNRQDYLNMLRKLCIKYVSLCISSPLKLIKCKLQCLKPPYTNNIYAADIVKDYIMI